RVQTERTLVVVDTMPPVIAAETPQLNAVLRNPVALVGTIADLHLDAYTLTLAVNGGAPSTVGDGHQSRTGAPLAAFDELTDGTYSLKISAVDLAQNSAELVVPFTID